MCSSYVQLGLFALLIVGLVFLCGTSNGDEDAAQDAASAKKKDDDVEMKEEEEEEEEEEQEEEKGPKLRKRATKTARAD